MLKEGIIEPATSPWSSPIVLVNKKDKSLRLCVDYRKLNAVSEGDAYPMPHVDDLIDRLGQAKFISALDLSKGYWQVPIAEESKPKTAFITPFGLYQFHVMPFGLQGAPATFQRLMNRVLLGFEDFSAAYLDDIIIFSETWNDHLHHLRQVLESLKSAGLTVKMRKCQLGMDECSYLEHVVGNGMVRPEAGKLSAIQNFPTPHSKKDVKVFLGLSGYYRKFIPDYSAVAAPLTDLTRRSAPNVVKWTEPCYKAFKKLKEILCTEPVLKSPDFRRPFILQTDASNRGVEAVLSQMDSEGTEHPVGYYSRKLLPREESYSTIEKECLAIKLGIQAFRVYLQGNPFEIQTDHRALIWLD